MPCFCETPSIKAEVYRDLCAFGDFPRSFGKKRTFIVGTFYLVWSLRPRSRCTPGSGTRADCRSCRSHRCTGRWGSPPGFRSCPRRELAAVGAEKTEVAGVSAAVRHESRLRAETLLSVWSPTNSHYVNWQLHSTGECCVSRLPTGHRDPLPSWRGRRRHRKVQSAEMF